MLNWFVLVTQVGQLVQPPFHLVLEPIAEGVHPWNVLFTDITLRSNPVKVFLDEPIFEELRIDVKLYWIVSCCDSFDVPLYVVILLDLFHVVEVDDNEESYEHCHAAKS